MGSIMSNQKSNLYKLGLVLVMSLVISACAGKKVQESIQVDEVGGGSSMVTEEGLTQGVTDEGLSGSGLDGSGLRGPQGSGPDDPLSKRVIYFEYDSSALTAEGDQIAQAHGQFLADNPEYSITLEGHADERGTSEYNLALGEGRAKSVSQIIGAYGIASDRLNLVSYGEERPAALGHDESAYSLNRRVEIIYQ